MNNEQVEYLRKYEKFSKILFVLEAMVQFRCLMEEFFDQMGIGQ